MKKIKVIYWSGTGNTEMMAKAVADGASSGGSVVELLDVSKATVHRRYQEYEQQMMQEK